MTFLDKSHHISKCFLPAHKTAMPFIPDYICSILIAVRCLWEGSNRKRPCCCPVKNAFDVMKDNPNNLIHTYILEMIVNNWLPSIRARNEYQYHVFNLNP